MKLFIVVFTIINLLFNALLYWRLRPILPGKRVYSVVFAAFIVLMLALMLGSRLLQDSLGETAYDLSDIGTVWFGFTLLAVQFALLSLLLQFICRLLGKASLLFKRLAANKELFAYLCLLPALLAYGWSFYQARSPQLETINLVSSRLPRGSISILHLSDLHMGSLDSLNHMQNALDMVHNTSPDMLVLTGDIVDGTRPVPESWNEPWAELSPPLGKYAVLGNHEAFGLHQAHNMRFLEQCGFTILRNQGMPVDDKLYIAGVDDPQFGIQFDESALWQDVDEMRYRILLKHRPDVQLADMRTFDLQLSGHTHGGQIFPGYYITKLVHPMNQGLYILPMGNYLYVSKGIGTWGAPLRFFATPQATLINLTSIMKHESTP